MMGEHGLEEDKAELGYVHKEKSIEKENNSRLTLYAINNGRQILKNSHQIFGILYQKQLYNK